MLDSQHWMIKFIIGWHHELGPLGRHHIMIGVHTGTKALISLQGSKIPKLRRHHIF